MKKFLLLLSLFFSLGLMFKTKAADTDVSEYPFAIYSKPVTGTAGETITISLEMKNESPVSGFQVDIVLPEGIEFVKDEYDYYEADKSMSRLISTKSHTFESNLQPDGSLRLLCYSGKNTAFEGNDGEVAIFEIKISNDAIIGSSTILLKEIVLTDDQGTNMKCPDSSFTLTILKNITLNDKGWATFSSNTNLQVETSGVKVCTGTCDGTKVSTAATGNSIIPANEGVLLRGEAGQKVSFSVAESGSSLAQNELLPTSTTSGLESIPTTGKVYVLNGDEFLVYAAEEFVPNKAYLHLSGAGAELRISSEDESTSIENITTDNNAKEAYSLQGQRLIQSQKGMSIINGEKVFVK